MKQLHFAIQRLSPGFLLCVFFLWPCVAAGDERIFTIDLSGSRSWEEIAVSGAPFKELQGFQAMKVYRAEKILVGWSFPGNTTFQHHMSHGDLTFRNGQLRSISSYGELMPLEEVVVVARQLHILLKQPLEQLAEWEAEAKAKGFEAKNYSFAARKCNPEIDCEIRHSFGVVYPFIIVIHAAWLTEGEIKKAKQPLPLPFTGGGLINLDPPSGKRYTPEEEHQKYKELYTPKPVSEKGQPSQSPSVIAANPSAKTTESDNRSFLWLWISLAVLVVAGVILLLSRGKA